MPRFCSVLGCGSNHARDRISFHRFPSIFNCNRKIDPLAKERRERWIEALRRSDLTESKIKYGFVCAKHFIGGAPAQLRDKDSPDWIPTQNMGYPNDKEKDELRLKRHQKAVDRGKRIDLMAKIGESLSINPVHFKTEQIDKVAQSQPAIESTVNQCEGEEMSILLDESILEQYLLEPPQDYSEFICEEMCRLCLEEKPDMWLFRSVITFEDQSTLDIAQIFQNLTGENTERLENPRLPKHICKTCVDLLVNAYSFHQKYEKSNEILTEFLSKRTEDDEQTDTISDPCLDMTRSGSYEDILCKFEPGAGNEAFSYCPDIASTDERLETDVKVEDSISSNEGSEPIVKLHRCPICLKKFSALELKRHCRSHETLKAYLNAAPRFNKKVKFYATPRTNNTCLFYRESVCHPCPFCSEEFEGEQFRAHVKQHRTEGNFRCNICNRIFIGRNHLKMHQLSHKQEAPYKCQECGKGFFKKKNFDFHQLTHTTSDDLPFKCLHCPRAFSNPEHLKRHSFNHEKCMSYQKYYKLSTAYVKCKQCLQKFKTKEKLSEHNCRFCCAKCHKIFDSKKGFAAHVCKFKLKLTQCQPCGKVFQLASSVRAHQYRCSQRTLCYVCGKNVANITQHMHSHYPHKRGVYSCAHCGKQYRYRVSLNRHVTQVHMNVTPFQCQYCAKRFKSKWNLAVHERIHLGVKKHMCNICGKGFLEKSYLKKHLNVHVRRDNFIADQLKDEYTDHVWSPGI